MTDHHHCLSAASYSLVDDAVEAFQHLQAAFAGAMLKTCGSAPGWTRRAYLPG
ncbi:hypothetical protein [Streptomyces spiramyceticus]|uniref:hypothetical protein n=1 Tax=Streptomyces spiramyceticus TaxID=299717 RepID=UPI00237C0A4A|nr:hypothetical protein [Streptomyces spiramyceticus]